MIARIEKSGIRVELEEDVTRYIDRKVGRLDRYMPRNARASAHAIVTIRNVASQAGNKYQCEVILHLPGETITAKESAPNKFAAIDIVEEKLKNQLRKYKQTRAARRAGVFNKVRQRFFSADASN